MNNDILCSGGNMDHIQKGHSFVKIEGEYYFKNVTLEKTPITVRCEDGEYYDTYVIKPEKPVMTVKEMIAEWRKGCSCAPVINPAWCVECTEALINAIEKRVDD